VEIRHLILDRDGVLNREQARYITQPADFHWIPGALEALSTFRRLGLRVSLATNQSAVGRQIMTEEQLEEVHARMRYDVLRHGGSLDAVLVCAHSPEACCVCRKPAPGLMDAAIALSGIRRTQTLVVGDDARDLEAARQAGLAAVLVRTGKGRVTEARVMGSETEVFEDLQHFATALMQRANSRHHYA